MRFSNTQGGPDEPAKAEGLDDAKKHRGHVAGHSRSRAASIVKHMRTPAMNSA